jgi:hypothetical protein
MLFSRAFAAGYGARVGGGKACSPAHRLNPFAPPRRSTVRSHTMTAPAEDIRRFRVRARHEDAHHGRIVLEPSFEAAAIAYAEHLPAGVGSHANISVIVHDLDSGHEHSFSIHMDGGEATPSD